jgi:GNAT superfamily N-acetyltransferase
MITTTYGQDWYEGGLRNAAVSIEPGRTIAAYDGEEIVGGASIHGRVMTVPGAVTPVAGITLVAVLPTHRRRGILTAMMREQLTDLHESGGEPIAALNAAEATIYACASPSTPSPAARSAAMSSTAPSRGWGRSSRSRPPPGSPTPPCGVTSSTSTLTPASPMTAPLTNR